MLICDEDKTVNVITEVIPQAPPLLLFSPDGAPLLPIIEADSLSLRDVKSILIRFITTLWSEL
jgi:hypothetical protein